MNKRIFPALVLILCLLLPMSAWASEVPGTEAVYHMKSIPDSWNPLEEGDDDRDLILSLTADKLFALSPDGGTLIPSLAATMPRDVTAEYAGTFGLPECARRGYAFSLDLDPRARWEDGLPITADDYLFTLNLLLDRGQLSLDLANLEDYYCGAEKPTDRVISLREAGFDSVEEAEEAGHTLFYVDTTYFWGLDAGWVPVTDGTRLQDAAIPSGVTERYVSAPYLYDRYLRTGASQSFFQGEFVGVSAGPVYTPREDVGLVKEGDFRIILILEHPTTAEALALKLAELTVIRENLFGDDYATSAAAYSATGPYRVISVSGGEMVLEENPHWLGKTDAPKADRIRLTSDIGA